MHTDLEYFIILVPFKKNYMAPFYGWVQLSQG